MLYAGPSDVKPRASSTGILLGRGTALQVVCSCCGTTVTLSDTGYNSGQTFPATAVTKMSALLV